MDNITLKSKHITRVIALTVTISFLTHDLLFACPPTTRHDNNALAQPTLFSQPKDLDESFARVVAAHLGFIIKRPLEGAPLADVQNILEYIQLILPGQLTVYKKKRLSITVRGSAEAGEILVYFPGGYILRYLNPEMHDSILPLSGTIFCTGYPISVNKYLCVQLVKPDASSQQAVMRLELLRGNVHDLNNCITGFGGVDGNPITEAAAAGSPSDAGREIRTKGIFAALFARFKEEQERLSSEEPLSSAIRNRVIQTTLKTPGLKRASVRALRTLGYRPVLRSLIFSVPFAKRSTMWLQSKFIVPTLEDLDSASQKCAEVISDKAKENIDVIFDSVGDASTSLEEAASHVERYMNMMDRLKSGTGRRIEYSIKLSAIVYEPWPKMAGEIDESKRERVKDALKKLLIEAKERDAIIRIDAEEYAYWRYTLRIYREVIDELADEGRNLVICDDRNTLRMGIVVQAYLKDAGKTLSDLMEWAGKKDYRVPIRLVKGAYDNSEKEWAASGHGPDEMELNGGKPYPSPVFEHKESTDANYELLTEYILRHNDRFQTAIASHNVRSIANAMSFMEEYGLAKEEVEFQMLYGMGEPLQLTIRGAGYPMRVYIPVGSFIAGMKYSGRRLEELGNKDNALTRTMAGDYEFLEGLGATAPRFQEGDSPAIIAPDLDIDHPLPSTTDTITSDKSTILTYAPADIANGSGDKRVMGSVAKALPVLVNSLITAGHRVNAQAGGAVVKVAEKRRIGIFIDKELGCKQLDAAREAIADIARNGGPLFENIAIVSGDVNTVALENFEEKKHVAKEDLIVVTRDENLDCLSPYEGTSVITKVNDRDLLQDSYYPLLEIVLFAIARHSSLHFTENELTEFYKAIPNIDIGGISQSEISSLFWDGSAGRPTNLVIIKLGIPNARQLTVDSQIYKDLCDYIAKHA